MDLFDLKHTESDLAQLELFRSQNNIAQATLHFRLENGFTQSELARLAQTTQARVSEIESLKGDPRLSTLGRVAHALGCMIDMIPLPASITSAFPGYRAMTSHDVRGTASTGMLGDPFPDWSQTPTVTEVWGKAYG